MSINTGINTENRAVIVDGLSRLLADTYTLYLKTHNYHWNVTGPMFTSLHALFEEQYNALALAVDVIAERIRALGEFAPGSYQAYAKLTAIKEETDVPNAENMLKNLLDSHEIIIRHARELLQTTSIETDEVTSDLLTQRMEFHEKNAWMMRSLLG
ncbi:Dps family protein [Marinicella litoralis]|uniref:Starvation-inducible DNA-binding protein n=1 Tax=Marinicella litoralis TaxID=644220 RepID=A0A4R6XWP5_9GAMM|nr:Dps family protein [Marinicella litoralis]TDR22577.1 starvation-inducible DNA-binding protein [Marinicella litoralis]